MAASEPILNGLVVGPIAAPLSIGQKNVADEAGDDEADKEAIAEGEIEAMKQVRVYKRFHDKTVLASRSWRNKAGNQ